MIIRCDWCLSDPLMTGYHDTEWGVPLRDDRKLFEFIVLDSFQAGLSWKTILHKRENFRLALDNFDPVLIAGYDSEKFYELLSDPGIIRNKLKINATIGNANIFLNIQKEFGTFSEYIWQFTKGRTIQNKWNERKQIPARSTESDAMSRDLIRRGFKFVGSTICYAFMQAAGMVNDHYTDCFRYNEIKTIE